MRTVFIIFTCLFLILITPLVLCSANESDKYSSTDADDIWQSGTVFWGHGESIALTFDDGPHPYYTDKILEILKKYNVRATFFVIGKNVGYYPDVFLRILNAGHEIGNHTMSHSHLSGHTFDYVMNQIQGTDDVINSLAEYKTRFLRPPGGIFDKNVQSAAKNNDILIALWTIDTKDWQHRSADNIVDGVLRFVRGGDIILMHDYLSGDCHTVEALDILIPELQKRGFSFVTLSEMYLSGG